MVITPTETNMKPRYLSRRADCSSVILQTFYSVLTGAHNILSRLTFSGLASRYHPVILSVSHLSRLRDPISNHVDIYTLDFGPIPMPQKLEKR